MLFLKPKSTILPVNKARVCDVIGAGCTSTIILLIKFLESLDQYCIVVLMTKELEF